jgi:excisionase family DNA binding protein
MFDFPGDVGLQPSQLGIPLRRNKGHKNVKSPKKRFIRANERLYSPIKRYERINHSTRRLNMSRIISQIDAMLTAKEVAEILSTSKRTVWRWAAEGRIPKPCKLSNRSARWKASELQKFFDAQRPDRA